MAALVERVGPPRLRRVGRGPDARFGALARSILFQQLAGRAATAIHGRFVALFPDATPTPAAVLALPEAALRGAGLSGAKAASIRDLAAQVASGDVRLEGIARRDDETVITELIKVRGTGRWTAEMFLIFNLRRLDVWPVDDYGVRKGYARAYGLDPMPTPRELASLGERFRPYRSVAAWYCWRAVEELVLPG